MLKSLSTLAFWLVFMVSGFLVQVWVVLRCLFVSSLDQRQRIAQEARLYWSAINLNWFFGTPSLLELKKQSEHLPNQFILVVNHRSNLDPLFVFAVGHPLVFLSKKSVLKIPVVGWWMKLCGDIPVERGEKASRERSLNLMKERIERGDSLLIFPEGTRQTDPEVAIGTLRDGAFNIAVQTGIPIVVLILQKTHKVCEKGSLFLNLFPLRYSFSSPIESKGLTQDKLKTKTLEKMLELVNSLDRESL